jgi:hypothetical protein
MRALFRAAVLLIGLTAAVCSARAVTKGELRRRYPTIEAFAHHFGAMDINYSAEHRLVLTAPLPPRPGQWSGMVEHPENYQDTDIGPFTLDYAVFYQGLTFAGLKAALRPDITVWDDPVAKISRGRHRYRVGTVREDLTVEIFPELTEAFPGRYYYIPALDAVFESPLDLPRAPYERLVYRRTLNRGSSARFTLTNGSTVTLRLGVIRHLDDERRFLVANHGRAGVVMGEMYPFADPNTDGRERHYYRHTNPISRLPSLALFNEVAGFELRDHPVEPETTIVYGVKIYPRYLARYEIPRGPILRPTVLHTRREDAPPEEGFTVGPVPAGSDLPRGSLAGQSEEPNPSDAHEAPLPHGFNPGETPDTLKSPSPTASPSVVPKLLPPPAEAPVNVVPVGPPVVIPSQAPVPPGKKPAFKPPPAPAAAPKK